MAGKTSEVQRRVVIRAPTSISGPRGQLYQQSLLHSPRSRYNAHVGTLMLCDQFSVHDVGFLHDANVHSILRLTAYS